MENNELKSIKICLNGELVDTFTERSHQGILECIAEIIGTYFTDKTDVPYRITGILRIAQIALGYVDCDIEADILTGAFKAIKVDLSDKRCKFNSQAYQRALMFIASELSNIIGREVTLVVHHADDIKDFASVDFWLYEKEKPAQKEKSAKA